MKKNIRLIVFIGVIVLLLSGALAIVLNLPENDDSGEKIDTSLDILLYDKTALDAEEITVKFSDDEYKLVGISYADQVSEAAEESSDTSESSENLRVNKDAEVVHIYMHYTMQDYENMELSRTMTDQLAYQCSYVTATKLVDKTGRKDSEYGLDNPVSTVTTVFSDNSVETLYIGNTAPDNQGIYVRHDGSDNVYLMQIDSVNMFLIKKLQMFEKTLTGEFDMDNEDNSITEVSITGTGYKDPISIDSKVSTTIASTYKMYSPYREVCAKGVVESFGESLYGMEGSEIVAAEVKDEDKKEFGLDKPYMKVKVKAADGTSVTMLASESDDDGNCYVMTEGGLIICKMPVEDVKNWYGVNYKDFLALTYLIPNLNNLESLTINYNGSETKFDVKHEVVINDLLEETLNTEVKQGKKKINYANFSTFINNVSGLSRKDMDIENLDGFEEEASFIFVYEGDEGLTDTLVIYRNEDGERAVVLNDVIEGTTYGEYADKLYEQIDKIGTGEGLEVISDESNETSDNESSD